VPDVTAVQEFTEAFRAEHEIDEAIAAFAASPGDPQPLARAIRAPPAREVMRRVR
jgi:hypothetical protein